MVYIEQVQILSVNERSCEPERDSRANSSRTSRQVQEVTFIMADGGLRAQGPGATASGSSTAHGRQFKASSQQPRPAAKAASGWCAAASNRAGLVDPRAPVRQQGRLRLVVKPGDTIAQSSTVRRKHDGKQYVVARASSWAPVWCSTGWRAEGWRPFERCPRPSAGASNPGVATPHEVEHNLLKRFIERRALDGDLDLLAWLLIGWSPSQRAVPGIAPRVASRRSRGSQRRRGDQTVLVPLEEKINGSRHEYMTSQHRRVARSRSIQGRTTPDLRRERATGWRATACCCRGARAA